MNVFGVRLFGLTPENAHKLLLTLALIVIVVVLRALLGLVLRLSRPSGGPGGRGEHDAERVRFWSKQGIKLLMLAILVLGLLSIWFDQPGRFATMAGLVTAGIAVALQHVITSFAAYLIILRGRIFNVGDRITMGGVRGDVVGLGFMQTSVMEMGEPPAEQAAPPAVWVTAWQYTGRIVRVTNDKIFDSPVYNYTRSFPFLWDEIHLPVPFDADMHRAEQILLDAAHRHTDDIARQAQEALGGLRKDYFLPEEISVAPAVYWRITDNWLAMTLRFVVPERGVRPILDRMNRDILAGLKAAGIGIASGTYDIVGLPTVKVQLTGNGGSDGSGDAKKTTALPSGSGSGA